MKKIRVIIADDHAILRAGLIALLATFGNIEVVGEASTGNEVIELMPKAAPDIVLMDIAMPGLDGISTTRRITREHPGAKVIILSQHDNREYVLSSIKAGASGYILKKAVASDLTSGIEAVYGGGYFFYPSVARTVVEDYLEQLKSGKHDQDTIERLSEREREVLKLIAEGLSSNEIANRLFISVKTVLGHRSNIMEKLDIHNRTELVKYAIRKGLIQADG
jgi:DNA-binding NarL/FixJ family response regulator